MTPGRLLDGRLEPITWSLGFVRADLSTCSGAYLAWQQRVLFPYGITVEWRPVQKDLSALLLDLTPLETTPIRSILVGSVDAKWTAYFDCDLTASGTASVVPVLSECVSTEAYVFRSQVARQRAATTRDPVRWQSVATSFEKFVGGDSMRSVVCVEQDGKWTFEAFGQPLPFEDVAKYSARRVRARFGATDLERYASAVGIRPFSPAFYAPDAVLFSRGGNIPVHNSLTLTDARSRFKIEVE